VRTSLQASGDGPPGRGARGPIPWHRVYEARDVPLAPGQPWRSEIRLSVETLEAP
jgi:hypothetical protein